MSDWISIDDRFPPIDVPTRPTGGIMMAKVTPICRCDNHNRFNGPGCYICRPLICGRDGDNFTVKRDGEIATYTPEQAQYLLEQLVIFCQPWGA